MSAAGVSRKEPTRCAKPLIRPDFGEPMNVSDLSSETVESERETRHIMGCNYINTDGFLSCLWTSIVFFFFIGSAICKAFNVVDRFLVREIIIKDCS